MSELYLVTSRSASPLSLGDFRTYAKADDLITADDSLMQNIIDNCTIWGERYTGRDFRQINYQLLLDELCPRIKIRRNTVVEVTSIENLVNNIFVAIDSNLYYVKRGLFDSEVILNSNSSWPTNTGEREQSFRITFSTQGYEDQNLLINTLKRHCLSVYMNRGDSFEFSDVINIGKLAKQSGATSYYDQIRIPRF